jgi:DDE domain
MLLLASSVCGLFKWRQFEPEMILLAVGWYLRFSLSYRDVEELLAERGLRADHVTVWRWVQRYAPEVNRRLRSRLNSTNDSWRVDETYIRVKGKWVYLYRAVDSNGATIDFLLSAKRDTASAKRFQSQSLGRCKPSDSAGDQHRRGRRLPASHRTTQSRGRSVRGLPASTGAVSQQCSGAGPPGDQTPGARRPAFSLLLGSLAHDRRLRGDAYDPQRPSVLECGGCEGRSAPLLHCWYVWDRKPDSLELSHPRPVRFQSCNTTPSSASFGSGSFASLREVLNIAPSRHRVPQILGESAAKVFSPPFTRTGDGRAGCAGIFGSIAVISGASEQR